MADTLKDNARKARRWIRLHPDETKRILNDIGRLDVCSWQGVDDDEDIEISDEDLEEFEELYVNR